MRRCIYTVGHGSRRLDEFLALLSAARIEALVDVRAFPVSRRYPHFSREPLQTTLAAEKIDYLWEGRAFGGFRKPVPDSPNAGIEPPAFRGFADHMMTEGFCAAAGTLLERAAGQRVALMCAERQPAQCHRSLLANFFAVQGAQVVHLLESGTALHRLNPRARPTPEGVLTYGVAGTGQLPF